MGIISFFENRATERTKIAILDTGEEFNLEILMNESHEWTSEVTRFPIEGGGIVSDHVLINPKTLRLSGIVGDSPINFFEFLQSTKNQPRTQTAIKFFESLHQSGSAITISSRLRTYPSMVCTGISLNRGKTSGNSFAYDITFDEVKFIQTLNSISDKKGGILDKNGALKKEGVGSYPNDAGKKSLSPASETVKNGATSTWEEGPIPFDEWPAWAQPLPMN